jgi:hypothetical protein
MSKAAQGQQMQLQEALKLLDKNGEPIKWDKQEDGSYTAKLEEKGTKDVNGKELPGATYIYSITPQTTIVDVGVVEVVEGTAPAGPIPKAEAKKLAAEDNTSKSKKRY